MDNLWFAVAIRGERDLEEDLIARLNLFDGAESGPKAEKPEVQPTPESRAGIRRAPTTDLL